MPKAIALLICLGFLGGVVVLAGTVLVCRLNPQAQQRQSLLWLAGWFGKGLLVPWLLWAILNFGISWKLQPFMPQVQAAQNSGDWLSAWITTTAIGFYVLSTYWTAATLIWALSRVTKDLQGDMWADFKGLCLTCGLGLALPAAVVVLLGGWANLGLAALVILIPLAGYTPSILTPKKAPPMYARAIARMKFGKYDEAEWEIIRELEKCEDDFEGWMMLAELYANHFRDLSQAEQTILDICEHPQTTPSQLSVALHRLADWHLRIGGDPEPAKRALQMIQDRLPGTHLARMARLRMQQLPDTADELRRQQTAATIPLPALGDSLDGEPVSGPMSDPQAAASAARQCVERLTKHPNDIETRERLARLLAEQLNQVDQGLEQLQLLLGLPGQPGAKRAQWLSLVAAWHLRYRNDRATGREYLERLVREHPESPQAFAARRRLFLLSIEEQRAKPQSGGNPPLDGVR